MSITTQSFTAPCLCWADKSDADVIEYILSLDEQSRGTSNETSQANVKSRYLHMPKEYRKHEEMLALGVKLFGTIQELDVNKLRKTYKKLIVRIHPDKNHHERAHDVFQLVHSCFECMEGQIKLTEQYLKQKQWYDTNSQRQKHTVPLFAHSRCMSMGREYKNTSSSTNKPWCFHNLMHSQSSPCTAAKVTQTTTTQTTSRVPINYIPYSFSETHLRSSNLRMPFSTKTLNKMHHKQDDSHGANKTHITHTTPLSFIMRAAEPSHSSMPEETSIINSSRHKFPYSSLTREMHASNNQSRHSSRKSNPSTLNTFATCKQRNTTDIKQDPVPSHLPCHCCIHTNHNDDNKEHDYTSLYTHVSHANNSNYSNRDKRCNKSQWQVRDSKYSTNDNNNKTRNWSEVEEWARHILDCDSDNENDSIDDKKMTHVHKDNSNLFTCDSKIFDNSYIPVSCENSYSIESKDKESNNENSGESSISSSRSSSSINDDIWEEMQNTYDDAHEVWCKHKRNKNEAVYSEHDFHKRKVPLTNYMRRCSTNSTSWDEDDGDSNEAEMVDECASPESFYYKYNKVHYKSYNSSNDRKLYSSPNSNAHSAPSLCSSLTFSSELLFASPYLSSSSSLSQSMSHLS